MNQLFNFRVILLILCNLCFGISVESAISYKFIKDVYKNPKHDLDKTSNIKSTKLVVTKVAAKGLKNHPLANKTSNIVLEKPKSKLNKISVTPDFSNTFTANTVSYNDLTQSFNDGEALLELSESTHIKIKKDSVNISHTY